MMGVLLNATCPCNNTADLVLETKMKPVPPSLSNYVQRQTHQEHSVCVCGVACKWQHLPPCKLQQTLQTRLCNPARMTNAPHQWH